MIQTKKLKMNNYFPATLAILEFTTIFIDIEIEEFFTGNIDLFVENDFNSYLGIKITPVTDGYDKLHMTLIDLITKVLKAANIND